MEFVRADIKVWETSGKPLDIGRVDSSQVSEPTPDYPANFLKKLVSGETVTPDDIQQTAKALNIDPSELQKLKKCDRL
ncbi:MAG: hypothetical protein ACFBSC_10195 [Microcoleaceae cyanobacterium]